MDQKGLKNILKWQKYVLGGNKIGEPTFAEDIFSGKLFADLGGETAFDRLKKIVFEECFWP